MVIARRITITIMLLAAIIPNIIAFVSNYTSRNIVYGSDNESKIEEAISKCVYPVSDTSGKPIYNNEDSGLVQVSDTLCVNRHCLVNGGSSTTSSEKQDNINYLFY